MKPALKTQRHCETMMQEIAEASAESILTSLDLGEGCSGAPDTPPTRDSQNEWFTPSGSSSPFSTKPSWSFSEAETCSVPFTSSTEFGRSFSQRQYSASANETSEEGVCNLDSTGQAPLNGCTTVMLRNIPNKYTRSGLLAVLVDRGFDPTIDCNNLYLPMDASSGCNLGYAFLNFTTHEKALGFMKQFDGCRLPSAGSRKVCSIVWANKQGVFQHSNPPTVKEQTVASGFSNQLGARPPTCKIFVGGLPVTTTENDLLDYFSKYGPTKEVSIVMNRQTGASRGFAFCEFTSPDAVDRVELAQTQKPHSINCRVVSVRPYNSNHFIPELGSQVQQKPQTMTFLMGNGMIHCPSHPSQIPLTYAPYGPQPTSYSHPILVNPSGIGMGFRGYANPQLHSFMSYQ